MERSARCARREFTFHGGKDAFDQRAQGIELGWEMLAHLKAHTGGPATGAALGRYYAVGFELLAAEGMVAFGIELGVGQHAADGRVPMCTAHQRRQRGTVIPRCLPRPLGQNQLPFQVHHGQPLQPVFPGALLTALCAKPVASTPTVTRLRRLPGMRRTTSSRARSSSWACSRARKRYSVV